MSDKILEFLQEKISRFQKLERTKQKPQHPQTRITGYKRGLQLSRYLSAYSSANYCGCRGKHITLGAIILTLGAGMLLYSVLNSYASGPKSRPVENISQKTLDPLNKIDKTDEKPQVRELLCQEKEIAGENKAREDQLRVLVSGTPIEAMVPYIAERDPRVAAFLIAIARKESSWGEHAPSKDGRTCYNYWGYKSSGTRGTSMGYACFGSDEEGVRKVGDRIRQLIDKKIQTPAQMVVWKCGSSCAGHDPAGVKKWISDVAFYYGKIISLNTPAPAGDRLVSFKN
jgi:hypothetical protein